MMNRARWMAATMAVLASTAMAAGPAAAQFNFEGRGGAAVPVGDLEDLVDVGGTAGLGLGYRVHPRVNLRLDGDVGIFTGADDFGAVPDLRLWNYNGGAEVSILDPAATRWTLTANIGAGATTIDTDDFAPGGGDDADFTETYFALNGGLRVGYDVTDNVNLFLGGQSYVTFTDEVDFARLAALTPALEGEEVDSVWSIPLYAGIRVNLPGGPTRVSAVSP